MEGKIFDIKRFALNDGPGIRTTVFFKGCPLKCTWCHNPEGISFDIEEFEQERFLDGEKFVQMQKIGKSVSVQTLMDEILKDVNFFTQSGGGVTFSGGEPLAQCDFLAQVLMECKKKDLHITIDTTGLCTTDKLDVISHYADLFLYDMKFVNSDLHYKYTGVKNTLIIKNLDFLLSNKSKVIIRVPIITGINDTSECIADLKDFVKNRKNQIKELHFLPFHNIGQSKYERFKKNYDLSGLSSQQPDDLNYLIEEFRSLEIKTQIGGL